MTKEEIEQVQTITPYKAMIKATQDNSLNNKGEVIEITHLVVRKDGYVHDVLVLLSYDMVPTSLTNLMGFDSCVMAEWLSDNFEKTLI